MGIPIYYRKGNESVVSSYDSFDLASKTGYKKFYCSNHEFSNAIAYFITPEIADSTVPFISLAGTGALTDLYVKEQDLDFDILFNSPQIIRGDLYTELSYGNVNQAGVTSHCYVILNVYHVSPSGTETLIGTINGKERTIGSGLSCIYRDLFKISITKKKFAIGDKLRFNLLYYSRASNASNMLYYIYFDASSRTQTAYNNPYSFKDSTDLSLFVPFFIDV